MKLSMIAVLAVMTAGPSLAQGTPLRAPTQGQLLLRAGDSYMSQTRMLATNRLQRPSDTAAAPLECLTHRKTGRYICKTRVQWTAIATGQAPVPE